MGSKVEKGDKVEKKAAKIAYYNYRMVDQVDSVNTPYNGNKDLFRYADIIAMNRNDPPVFIQVKTQSFGDKEYYKNKALLLHSEHMKCEFWIRKEHLKEPEWHFYRFNGIEFKQYFKSGTLDIANTGKLFEEKMSSKNFNDAKTVRQ